MIAELNIAIDHLDRCRAEWQQANEILKDIGMRVIDLSINEQQALCASYGYKPIQEILPDASETDDGRWDAFYSGWRFRQYEERVIEDKYEKTV